MPNLFQEFPMSREASPVEPAVLLTIICETVLKDRIVQILKNHSVSGYTINQVQGEGGHGRRLSDMSGYNTNIEIKTVVSPEISDAILWAVKEHKGKHALIAFRQNVEALS
jgi:nitrogen regulatory protein PII